MSEYCLLTAKRRACALVLAAFTFAAAGVAHAARSEAGVLFLDPDRSSFWRTATNNVLVLPIDFPATASSATLIVEGAGYASTNSGISSGEFVLTLPAAVDPGSENVYSMTLAFDDGTTNRATVGVVQSVGDGGGSTRCVLPENGRKWRRFTSRAVLPVPYGVSSVTVGGESFDTGLGGAQGWFAIGPYGNANVEVAVSIEDDSGTWSAALVSGLPGTTIIVW